MITNQSAFKLVVLMFGAFEYTIILVMSRDISFVFSGCSVDNMNVQMLHEKGYCKSLETCEILWYVRKTVP